MSQPTYTVTVENPDVPYSFERTAPITDLHGEQQVMANLLTEHGDTVTFQSGNGSGYITVQRND